VVLAGASGAFAEMIDRDNVEQFIRPTSNGYPDVDTYRTLQFYIEVK